MAPRKCKSGLEEHIKNFKDFQVAPLDRPNPSDQYASQSQFTKYGLQEIRAILHKRRQIRQSKEKSDF